MKIIAAFPLLFLLLVSPSNGGALDGSGQQWEYLEWSVANPSYSGNPFDLLATATFTHSVSGETRTTEFFYGGSNTWKVRFSGTRTGTWVATTSSADPQLAGLSGTITVLANSNPAATGFLVNQGNKVAIQTKEGIKGYVLQIYTDDRDFPSYGDAPEDSLIHWQGQETALAGAYCNQSLAQGFDSIFLHLNNEWLKLGANRWNQHTSTDPDLASFQIIDLVLDEARRKGCQLYIWAWGDEARRWTPVGLSGGINGTVDRRLQRYIAARLGPRPNWLMGYGFDLEEWVTNSQIASWASYLKARMGWPHLLDARNRPNAETTLLSYNDLNHTYAEAVANLDADTTRPHLFNEQDSYLRTSDTTMDWTRQHLWKYTLAGGHGGYWGRNQDTGQNYPNPWQILAFRKFWNDRFLLDFSRANNLTNNYALKTPDNLNYVFYRENSSSVLMNLSGMNGSQPAIAIDTKKVYAEISLGILAAASQTWTAPYASDWAIAVGDFTVETPPPPVPLSLFEAFAQTYNFEANDALPSADPDHDGVNSATELMLGTNPADAADTGAGLISVTNGEDFIDLVFTIDPALNVTVAGDFLQLRDGGDGGPFLLTGQTQAGLNGVWLNVLPSLVSGSTYRIRLQRSSGVTGFARLFFEDP